ncbi:hypothetical protein NC652_036342 [Populus alba x Populus x berolinensis]|nr:hypothetical protein NC652_036342 [Populus alba x Populus x berolinensis]
MKAIDGPPLQATNLGDFESNGEEELYMNEGLSLLFRVGKCWCSKTSCWVGWTRNLERWCNPSKVLPLNPKLKNVEMWLPK